MSEQPQLRTGNFEELRGGHRNLPGNGALPGPRPSRGVVQLAKANGRYIPPRRPTPVRKNFKAAKVKP
jgi:hypothetical protein